LNEAITLYNAFLERAASLPEQAAGVKRAKERLDAARATLQGLLGRP